MPYTINKSNGAPLLVLDDGTIDTSTSIGLVGRNYVGYGETQNENLVYLLENFANDSAPSRPITGQTWFDTLNNRLNAFDGTNWNPVGTATVDDTAPETPANGSLWLSQTTGQLKIFNNNAWNLVGPEASAGFGITRATSTVLLDSQGISRPVILLTIDTTVVGIITSTAFTLNPSNIVLGFSNLGAGLTMSSTHTFTGNLNGNAATASKLQSVRTINGVGFTGETDINIKSSTTRALIKGDYLTGSNFDGSAVTTWAVDASSANISGKIVARNSSGGFSASLITSDLIGNVTGNVNVTTGTSRFNVVEATRFVGESLSGNSFSATQLQTARRINGVLFNGVEDITVTANASTLTGNSLNGNISGSNLTSVGTLSSLQIADPGLTIGGGSQLALYANDGIAIKAENTLSIKVADADKTGGYAAVEFLSAAASLSLGADALSTLSPSTNDNIDLGNSLRKWHKVFATTLVGNAETATLATTATNIVGGSAGAVVYQTAAGTTSTLAVGSAGQVLRAGSANTIFWDSISFENLTEGNYVTLRNTTTSADVTYYNSESPVTISVDATSANTASKVVARDSNGNFSAGTITASLTGEVTGNASTATALKTARTINGVSFDGSANITVTALDPTKVAIAGATMTGYLSLHAAPTASNHATTKAYVDTRLPQYTFTYGNTVYSTSGYTGSVGSWSNSANYFDVFPPSGKTMANLMAFVPSIAVIYFAGTVNGDDAMRCTWSNLGDRIRVYVQNTEQRSTPAANYMAIWS